MPWRPVYLCLNEWAPGRRALRLCRRAVSENLPRSTPARSSHRAGRSQPVREWPACPAGEPRDVGDRLLQRYDCVSQPLAARGQRPSELCSRRESWACLPRRSVISGLVHLTETLGIALSPTASECRIVVDEDVGAIRDRLTLVQRVDEDEELAILIPGWVQVFLVLPAELPIVEERVAATVRRGIGIEPGGQERRHRGRRRPKLDVEKVRRVVPRRRWIEGRLASRRQRIVEASQHRLLSRVRTHCGRASPVPLVEP